MAVERMDTKVVEIRPLESGERYEAKVTNIFGLDGNKIPLPKGCHYWGMGWGKTSQEAEESAKKDAMKVLSSL